MNVKVKHGNETIVYTEEEISLLSKEELRRLKREIQTNIEEVSAKRAKYMALNKDRYKSKEYYQKLSSYKSVIAILKKAIDYLSGIAENCKQNELIYREHWLWNFYMNTKTCIRKGKFEKIVKCTDERTKYHVEIGE